MKKSGVKILLNTEVTPGFIRDGGYDAVILAAGSAAAKPPIEGLDGEGIEHATTVYTRLGNLSERVAVLGGGLVGCETGLFLAENGHSVTIIEMREEIAPEANWMHREGMMQSFAKADITARAGVKIIKVEDGKGVNDNPDEESLFEVAALEHINDDVPPAFIWTTAMDEMVPCRNSLKLALALAEHKVPFELHVFERGYHALSCADESSAVVKALSYMA